MDRIYPPHDIRSLLNIQNRHENGKIKLLIKTKKLVATLTRKILKFYLTN